jgi:predicted RNA binding protein YcfA (HicA-like mRNA interferase family)
MPPVPLLRPPDVVAAFRKHGWEVARQRGSHIILTKPDTLQPSLFLTTHKSREVPCAFSSPAQD